MSYTDFKARWTGRRIDADSVYSYQCQDLIIQYAREELHTGASMYGNAIDMWTQPPQGLVDTTDAINGTDCQPGDIVIFRTAGRNDFAGDGHIGIADHQDASNVWVLEQNASGSATGTGIDAIGVHRAISKSRIAGIRRPKPAPVAPQAPLWTVQPIADKQVRVKPGSRKWNLAHGNFNDVAANPITQADDNTVFTARGILHHREIPQYNYYVEDPNTPHGWNVLDCVDYIAPAPPPPPPPQPQLSKPESAPIPVPKITTYTVLPDVIMYFDSSDDAKTRRNARGTLNKGSYIELERVERTVRIVRQNQDRTSYWVNDFDNTIEVPKSVEVAPPVIATPPLPEKLKEVITKAAEDIPVKEESDMATTWKQCTPIKVNPNTGQWTAVKYHSTNDMPMQIRSLDGKMPAEITLPAHKELKLVSTFWYDGKQYARDEVLTSSHRYYALPFDILEKVVQPEVTQRFDMDHDGDVDINDYQEMVFKYLRPGIDVVAKTVNTVKAVSSPKSAPRKFIDGFVNSKKKEKV